MYHKTVRPWTREEHLLAAELAFSAQQAATVEGCDECALHRSPCGSGKVPLYENLSAAPAHTESQQTISLSHICRHRHLLLLLVTSEVSQYLPAPLCSALALALVGGVGMYELGVEG